MGFIKGLLYSYPFWLNIHIVSFLAYHNLINGIREIILENIIMCLHFSDSACDIKKYIQKNMYYFI